MIDKYRLQLQLLPRLEGYNLILKEPIDISFTENKDQIKEVDYLHYLFCQEKKNSESQFNKLAEGVDDIEPSRVTKQIDKLFEKIPTDKEALRKFVGKNLSDITLWQAYSILKKDEDLTNSFNLFIDTFKDNVMNITKENRNLQVNLTPFQILNEIKSLISSIKDKLNQYSESHEKVADLLREFGNTLDEFQNIILKSINENDFIFSLLKDSEFYKYRNQISDFSFYCGFLDKESKTKLSQSFSELLSFVDSIYAYHNSLPIESANPLSVSKAAYSCFQSINSIISEEATIVSVYRQHLISISGIFEDISIAFKDLVCLKPIVSRLLPFLLSMLNNIEPLLEQFSIIGYGIKIHNFLISFYQAINSLKKLEFDSSMVSHVHTNVILSDNVNVYEDIVKTKELIEASSIHPSNDYDIGELILLLVNPSKETKSTEGVMKGAKLEKVTESIEEIKSRISKFNNTNSADFRNSKTIQSFAKLSKKLLVVGQSVDALKSNNPEINDQYVDVIESLNASIFNLIDANCPPIDTMTSFSCVRSICILLEKSIKMLNHAESTNVDPKDDKKTLKAILKYFNQLSQDFNEPFLIENVPEIESYQKELIQILENNAEKYDNAARECYVSNTLEFILTFISIILSLTSQMESKAFELSEVFDDVDIACSSLLKSLEVLSLQDQMSSSQLSLPVHHLIKLLSQQLEKVTMIRYTLGVAIPQQLVRPIIEYRASIDFLPSTVFPYDSDHNSINNESATKLVITALNCLSLARWKLGHLKEYYLYDQDLKVILKDVSDELKMAQSTAEGDEKLDQSAVANFKADNTNMLQTVDNIYSILGIYNERTGDEPTDYIDIFKTLIQQVTETWNKDLSKNNNVTQSMESARKRLNDAIELLHGDAVKYQAFVNPIEQFGDSFLVPYLAASATRYGGDEFYKTAMDAKYVDFPAGNDKLKKGMEIMNSFINIITISPDEVQKMIAAPMIYYVAAAKLMAYRQYQEFLDLAITFMEARPHELNNICFLLSYHMHRIFEKCAPNTIKSKDSIAQTLKVLYMQHANSKLADTYYYTTVFSTMIPKDHAPIFTVLSAPMRECFHCRIQLSTVNFKEAIAYLNGIIPTQGRLNELKSIYDGQSKLEDEVGLVVNSTKNPTDGKADEIDDLDIQQQDVVVSRNIQVLQPKRVTITKMFSFNKFVQPIKIQGRVLSQNNSTISSILDENNEFEINNHNGRIYEPLQTQIPIQEKNILTKKTWQTLIQTNFASPNSDNVNRESHYKKIWYTKPVSKNNIEYTYNELNLPEFELIQPDIRNEYNLPEEDKEAEECTIKTVLSSELMRKISYSIDEREFSLNTLGDIFENQFTPKQIKPFPSEKEYAAPKTVPAALKKLKKAKEGELVNIIKPDKSTHEELLNSLVFAVSRFMDIISPSNVEALCSFISIFSKEELDENLLPWVYHQFSPNHYPKNFFCRYLESVSTYMRTVFIERTENNEMINALNSYPYLIHIAIASALSRCAKKPELKVFSKVKQASAIHDFVNSTSFVISNTSSYLVSKEINKALTLFMVSIAPSCDEFAFLTSFDSYLRNLNNLEVIELVGDLQISKVSAELANFKYQLCLLRCFAPQKEFIQAISSYKEPIFESLFKNSSYAFADNDTKSITKFIRIMSEISLVAESIEGELNKDKINENTALIASKIIKYLDIAIANYTNEVIKSDVSLVEHLLIPVLLVLHSAPRDEVIEYFYNYSNEEKNLFFNYIYETNMSIMTKSNSPNPFEPLPQFITREEHLDYLEDKSINTQYVNYTLFSEFTIRVVEFLCKYIRVHQLPIEILDNATICVNSLFNRHQLQSNYQHCLYLLVYFVTIHTNLFFTDNSNLNSFRSIVVRAYELISYELQVARSTGVTILVHLMYCDYLVTNCVIISGYYIMETHQKFALEKNLINRRNQLLLYTNLVIQIDLYANNFSLKEFVEKAGIVIDKLKLLHRCIKDKLFSKQSQQSQYAAIMKIADQFVEIPTLRLFWLEEMAKYNVQKKLLAQAYQSQVRVISLIVSVLKGLGKYDGIPYSVDNFFAENAYYKVDDLVNYEYEVYPSKHINVTEQKEKEIQKLKRKEQEAQQQKEQKKETTENQADQEDTNNNDEQENAANDEIESDSKPRKLTEDDYKMIYYNSHKFTEEYLKKSIIEAMQFAFDGNLVRQFSQINQQFHLYITDSEMSGKVFEKIETPLYFYLYGERSKGKTVTMRIYSVSIPKIEDFAQALVDEKSPYSAIKSTKFRVNIYDSIVEAENKVNGGRFVIPVYSEKVITFRGESSIYFSDYCMPDDELESDSWSSISVTRTFFKTSHALPSDSLYVNAKKKVVRTITRKALISSRVKDSADFLAISRSATRNFRRSVGLTALVYSLNKTLIDEKGIGAQLIQEFKSHIKDPDFNLLTKSFIQDISESMRLYVDRVRPLINPIPAIEDYKKIYDAAQATAKNLRVTNYEFTHL